MRHPAVTAAIAILILGALGALVWVSIALVHGAGQLNTQQTTAAMRLRHGDAVWACLQTCGAECMGDYDDLPLSEHCARACTNMCGGPDY